MCVWAFYEYIAARFFSLFTNFRLRKPEPMAAEAGQPAAKEESTGAQSEDNTGQKTELHHPETENSVPLQIDDAPLAKDSQNGYNNEAQPSTDETKEQTQPHPVPTTQKEEDGKDQSATQTAIPKESQEAGELLPVITTNVDETESIATLDNVIEQSKKSTDRDTNEESKDVASYVSTPVEQKLKEQDEPAAAQITDMELAAETGEESPLPSDQIAGSSTQAKPVVPSEESQTVEDVSPDVQPVCESPESADQTVATSVAVDAKENKAPEDSQFYSEGTSGNKAQKDTECPEQTTSLQQIQGKVEEHVPVTEDVRKSGEQNVFSEQHESDSYEGVSSPDAGAVSEQVIDTKMQVSDDAFDIPRSAEGHANSVIEEAQREYQSGDVKMESSGVETVDKSAEQKLETVETITNATEQSTLKSNLIVTADSYVAQSFVQEPSSDDVAVNKVVIDESPVSQEGSGTVEQEESSQQKASGDSNEQVFGQSENETKTENVQEQMIESESAVFEDEKKGSENTVLKVDLTAETETPERVAESPSSDVIKESENQGKIEDPTTQTVTSEEVTNLHSGDERKDTYKQEDPTTQTEMSEKETILVTEEVLAVSQSEEIEGIQSNVPKAATTDAAKSVNQVSVDEETEHHLQSNQDARLAESPGAPHDEAPSQVTAVQTQVEKETPLATEETLMETQSEIIQPNAPESATTEDAVGFTHQAPADEKTEPYLQCEEDAKLTESPALPQEEVLDQVIDVQSGILEAEEPISVTQETSAKQEIDSTQADSTLEDPPIPCDAAIESTSEQQQDDSPTESKEVEQAPIQDSALPLSSRQEIESMQTREFNSEDIVQEHVVQSSESSPGEAHEVSPLISSETPAVMEQPQPAPIAEPRNDDGQQGDLASESTESPEVPPEAPRDEAQSKSCADAPETQVRDINKSSSTEAADVQEEESSPKNIDTAEITAGQQSELHHVDDLVRLEQTAAAAEQPQLSDEQPQGSQQEVTNDVKTGDIQADGSVQEELGSAPGQETDALDIVTKESEGP